MSGFSKQDIENAKYISKNAVVDISINHDGAKVFFDKLYASDKKMCSDFVFINVDAHSDIHINMRHDDVTYANWVNFIILNYKIDSFYWIAPDWLIKIKKKSDEKQLLDAGPLNFLYSDLKGGKYSKKVLLNHKDYEIISKEKIATLNKNCDDFGLDRFYDENLFKDFTINMVNIGNLPDLKSKKIFLSIDADFFSNFERKENKYPSFLRKKILYNNFSKFLKDLRKKEIQPDVITLSYSPGFINAEEKKDITQFFNLLKQEQ